MESLTNHKKGSTDAGQDEAHEYHLDEKNGMV